MIIIPLMAIMFYRFFSKKVDAVKQIGKPVLLVASTDMTHYESQEQAQSKDRLAIDKIYRLRPPWSFGNRERI